MENIYLNDLISEKEILEIQIRYEKIGEVDIDIVCFMLDKNNKILTDDCFIFYGSRYWKEFKYDNIMRPSSLDSSFFGENEQNNNVENFDTNLFFIPTKTNILIESIIIFATVYQNPYYNKLPLKASRDGLFEITLLDYKTKNDKLTFDFIINEPSISIELGYFKKINGDWIFIKSGKHSNLELADLVIQYT